MLHTICVRGGDLQVRAQMNELHCACREYCDESAIMRQRTLLVCAFSHVPCMTQLYVCVCVYYVLYIDNEVYCL